MSGDKWPCEYCTYENFPASTKCTLCRAPRPQHLINNTSNAERDIYKMAAHMSQSSRRGNATTSSGTIDITGKWACQMCTFLNLLKNTRCVQCFTPRKKISPVTTPSPQDSLKQPLSVNVNLGDSQNSSKNSSRNSSRKSSPNSPEAAKANNNDINRAIVSYARTAIKWVCKSCTYENWPKSPKCVICAQNKSTRASSENLKECVESPGTCTSDRKNRDPSSPPCRSPDGETQEGATASGITADERQKLEDKKLKLLRRKLRDRDWLWLNACTGIVDGDSRALEAYLSSGGDPARQLTQDEITLLNRPSAFEVGYTLVHLAIRFKREDILAVLLTANDVATKTVKRLPAHTSPNIASEIRREISSSVRQRKGDFPCYFLTDCVTFALPSDILDFPRSVQAQLLDEVLDKDVQNELEVEEFVINWDISIRETLGSRLYALWNRTAGDCLLDSVLQATWGVFDIDNSLRSVLADCLNDGAMMFYPRWKEYETMQAELLQFSLDESQWHHDWAVLLSLASQPGSSLEQTHIFALAHILRRPIIVYGVKYVKSFRGETIGYARFQGVYLPLLWEQSFCWKTPISLGYTRGHFSALVPMEADSDITIGAGAHMENNEDCQINYLPLVDRDGKFLPLHFLTGSEVGREENLLLEWLDCCYTKSGILVAKQKIGKRPALVRHMIDEWLDHYRHLSQVVPPCHPGSIPGQTYSDGESDQE